MAVGAMLATVSAINADFFGAAKLPTILAHERQRPQRYAREIWGRHPAALGLIAGWAILISRYVDLHAISAAASAGFLIVFAMVNVDNAKLARLTGSRRWVSVLAAVACLGALGQRDILCSSSRPMPCCVLAVSEPGPRRRYNVLWRVNCASTEWPVGGHCEEKHMSPKENSMSLHICIHRATCAWAIVLGLVVLSMAGPARAQPVDIPATWGGDFWGPPG
jgi:hypothetical protein